MGALLLCCMSGCTAVWARGHGDVGRLAAPGVQLGYATLAAFYACLIAAVAWILRRLARAPLARYGEPERALRVG